MIYPPRLLSVLGATEIRSEPLVIPWPMPGNLGGFVLFATFDQWRDFIVRWSLPPGVPDIVTVKFERAQKLHLLGWVDGDLIKAGELVALTALELTLKDRYGGKVKKDKRGNISFAALLRYVPTSDGLTDADFPMNRRCGGGVVVDRLTGTAKPTLAQIRNDLTHGYPFDGFLWAGLLELVRDLIAHAYRDIILTAMPARIDKRP